MEVHDNVHMGEQFGFESTECPARYGHEEITGILFESLKLLVIYIYITFAALATV